MKNNSLLFLLIIAFAFVAVFVFWNISNSLDEYETDASSHETVGTNQGDSLSASPLEETASGTELDDNSEEQEEVSANDSIETENSFAGYESEIISPPLMSDAIEDLSPEISADKKLSKYIKIVNEGTYKYKITEQRQIGGLSIPVVTTIWFGDSYVSIVENEMHNISTEVFITNDEAYMLNINDNSADLLDKNAVDIPTPDFDGLTYVSAGHTSIGSVIYEYERYTNTDKQTVDYLFIDGELKKAKIYTSDYDYEILTIEIIDDISDGRSRLPENLKITDRR